MDAVTREKFFYEKFWKNLKNSYSGDKWHFSSNTPYPAVVDFLKFLQTRKAKGNFLDMGCGNGRHAVLFAKNKFESFGIDFSQEAINIAKKNAFDNNVTVKYSSGNVLSLPYRNNFFNIVLDSGCLHHLRKYQWPSYILNLKKVLMPSGYFCLVCFSINSAKHIPKFGLGNRQRNWTVRKGHYNHIFYRKEIESLFKKDFKLLKIYEMQKGDYPLNFWVVYMQKI